MEKPNVLIFGGMIGLAQAVVQYLVPPHPNEPLVAHVRMRDKCSLSPPTTFVAKDFLGLLEDRKDMIDYKQANLTNPAAVAECFNEPAPNGRPYTHVLDFTGNPLFNHSSAIQIVQTFNIGTNIAREAKRHGVKAIVRSQPPWYEHLDAAAKYKEGDPNGWRPMATKGIWWHETLRAMGSIPDLPFCVVRCGYVYGPGLYMTEPLTATVIGLIQKNIGGVITIPWSSSVRKNTVHSEDLAVALWSVMVWMASIDRKTANSLAGVNLPPTNDPELPSVPGAIASDEVIVPAFNAVDDGDTTLQTMGDEIAKVFGIQLEFCGSDTKELHGISDIEFMENVNEIYCSEWAKIITNSTPPVPHTPLTPYAQTYHFRERGCALDGTKLKEMLSFHPKHPRFESATIRSWIEWCRQEGIWPEGPLYP